MTPPAATAAGRRPQTAPRRASAPRPPRRISGPVGGRAATRVAPGVKPSVRLGPSPAVRMAAWIRALPEHAFLDRLIRGRIWIPLLGVMLAGIVAMQVEVLKLGSSMGRWIERSSTLSGRNAELRASVASLGDDQRIESLAAAMGMVMPGPGQLAFVTAQRGNLRTALGAVHSPDPTTFLANLPSDTQSGLASALSSPASATSTASGAAATVVPSTAAPATTTPATTTPATTPAATTTGAPVSSPASTSSSSPTSSGPSGSASQSGSPPSGQGGAAAPGPAAGSPSPAAGAPTGAAGLSSGQSGN